jgi:hypothetical protein
VRVGVKTSIGDVRYCEEAERSELELVEKECTVQATLVFCRVALVAHRGQLQTNSIGLETAFASASIPRQPRRRPDIFGAHRTSIVNNASVLVIQ